MGDVNLKGMAKALREYADELVKREPGGTDPIQLAHRKLAIFGFSAAMLEQAAAMIDVAAARLDTSGGD